MRILLILLSFLPIVACHGGGSAAGTDGSVGTDAGPEPDALPPNGVAIADLDGDGKLDLALAGETYDASGMRVALARILLGDGTGQFQPGSSYPADSPEAQSPLALADLDGDGKIDLVVARSSAGTVDVRLGDGTFGEAIAYPVGRRPIAPAVADLDGDGKADMIVANFADATVSILRGNGDGTFQAKGRSQHGRVAR